MGGYEGSVDMSPEHIHHHQDTKKIIDRMSRAIGHMESIKRMVEEGRDCSEILIQLSAVRSAINNVGKIILQDHIGNCVVDAVETGDKKVLEDLNNAVDKFLK
jgi:DNA-binding FrmR family transcriptional regulator